MTMLRVSSTPVLCERCDDATSCGACPTTTSPPPKKSTSLLRLPKLRLGRRKSSSTFDLDREEELSSNNSLEQVERLAGGCLKIPTQAMSLQETYTTPIGLDVANSDESARSVSFGAIDVLIFPLQLGDNPSVSVGPPLAIGNQLHARLSLQVDEYESTRPERRSKQELAVPRSIREDWLRDEGVARSEWRRVEDELLAIKKSRKASAKGGASSQFFLKLFGNNNNSRRPKRTSVMRK